MAEKKDNSVKTVSLVMIIMFLSKVTGLMRDVMFKGHYGTNSIYADAFGFASKIPREFLDIALASAISASFIPVFNSYLQKRSRDEAFKLANNFITVVMIAAAAITVASIGGADIITGLLLDKGMSAETKLMASQLLRIMLLTIVLSGAAFSLTGVLQSLGEFNIPAGMSVLSNVIIIGYYIFLIDKFGIVGLCIAFVLGWATQILIQIPSLRKKGYHYRFYLNLKDTGLREIVALVPPVLVSSWILPINSLVHTKFVSSIPGGIGAFETANIIYSVITGIFILSLANVVFPKLARQNAGDSPEAFGETLTQTIRVMLFFLIPMMTGLVILGEPIIRLIFERNLFTEASTAQSAYAMRFYTLGMVGFGLQTILSRGFYASMDGKTPMITSLIAIAANLVLSAALINALGIGGPALASAISINITGFIMLFVMGRRNKGMLTRKLWLDLLKMAVCAVVMALAVYLPMLYFLGFGRTVPIQLLTIGIPVVCGILVYFVLAYLFKIDEVRVMTSMIAKFYAKLLKRGAKNAK